MFTPKPSRSTDRSQFFASPLISTLSVKSLQSAFTTPSSLTKRIVLNSKNSTPDSLRSIFSPPPGFEDHPAPKRKLTFITEETVYDQITGNNDQSLCEKCLKIISNLDIEKSLNMTEEKFDNLDINKENDFQTGYLAQLRESMRSQMKRHIKQLFEVQTQYEHKLQTFKAEIESVSKTLTRDLIEKDIIITDLVEKLREYNPQFICNFSLMQCGSCKILSTELKNKAQFIDEIQEYLKKIGVNKEILQQKALFHFINDEILSGKCKTLRQDIHKRMIILEESLYQVIENIQENDIISKLQDLTLSIKSLFTLCRSLEKLSSLD
jgi:hypothetical protein